MKMFYIREFKVGDELEIYQLFYDTVHHVNTRDYTEEQVNIWAPEKPDMTQWQTTLNENYTFVAISKENKAIIGFSDLEKNGYLNRGYVHKNFQGQGVGDALFKAIENKARELGLKKLFSDVSITAKPFIEKQGFIIEAEQTKKLGGITFTNYLMTKEL